MNEITLVSGIYLQKLPNASLYTTSLQLILSVQLAYDYSSCNEEARKLAQSKGLSFDTFWNTYTHSSEDRRILLDDGDLMGYELVSRRHVKYLFSDFNELNNLKQRMVAQGLNVKEHNLPQYRPAGNVDCNNITYLTKLIEAMKAEYLRRHILLKMCQNKQLDPIIITSRELRFYLAALMKEEKLEKYDLAVDNELQYYSLSLTECVLTPRSAIIGIHVPLINKGLKTIALQRVITPMFAYNDYSCFIKLQIIDLAIYNQNDEIKILIPKCDAMRDEICYLTSYYDNNVLSVLCAKSMIAGTTTNELANICPMECTKTGSKQIFVFPVSTNKFHITHATHPIEGKCQNYTVIITPEENIGGIWIEIPCNCEMIYKDEVIVPTRLSCVDNNTKMTYYRVIPSHWSKLKSINIPSIYQTQPKFSNIDECLDRSWKRRMQNNQKEHQPRNESMEENWTNISLWLSICALITGTASICYQCLLSYKRKHRQRVDSCQRARNRKLTEKRFDETCVNIRNVKEFVRPREKSIPAMEMERVEPYGECSGGTIQFGRVSDGYLTPSEIASVPSPTRRQLPTPKDLPDPSVLLELLPRAARYNNAETIITTEYDVPRNVS